VKILAKCITCAYLQQVYFDYRGIKTVFVNA